MPRVFLARKGYGARLEPERTGSRGKRIFQLVFCRKTAPRNRDSDDVPQMRGNILLLCTG